MTLRVTLAERLGHISAADAQRGEDAEFWQLERPLRLGRDVPAETPVERALRRAGAPAGCGLRRLMPDPQEKECEGLWQLRWRLRGYCAQGTPAGHTLVMAPALRAMSSGRERCAGRT
ncbi:hypothetical protein [Sorangium sp. So ce388]|uniref:hypothetical protein n=1 Tax=Sorangium sp. So ce388 TaxID=3133309 RepID=UPI003F5C6D20